MGEEIFDFCSKVASGEIIPKAVRLAQNDFKRWKKERIIIPDTCQNYFALDFLSTI